jgi:hypothetical protein
MRFGNRLESDSIHRWRRRELLYQKSLREQGLTYRDTLIPYFGREVFHDGEIYIKDLNLEKRQVTLSLRNVSAVDQVVDELMRQGRSTKSFNKYDFVTRVRLDAVTKFSVSWKQPAGVLEYVCAEVGKVAGRYSLKIRCRGERGEIGIVSVVFLKAWIEDISPRIRKYVSGTKAREILSLSKSAWDESYRRLQK